MEPFISSGLPKNSQPHSAWMVVVLLDVDVHTSACGLSCFSVLCVFNLLCVHGGKVGLWVIWYKNAHIAQHWCDKLEEDVCGSTRVYIPCVLFSGFLLHLFLHIWSDICTFQSKFGLGNKNTCFFRECFISAEGAGPTENRAQRRTFLLHFQQPL